MSCATTSRSPIFSAWNRASSQLTGLFPEEIKAVRERNWAAAEKETARLEKNGIEIVFSDDEDYPPRLAEIYDPPDLIYVRGDRALLRREKLAVVGSRRGGAYGQSALNRVLPTCCRAGLVIVSGMAFGIDSMAHRVALRENGGTIGVNAGGLLHLNPPGNSALIRKIVERGAVISEFPLDVTPRPFLFPVRNRIISGISRAVLVVEAAMRSGSLITARLALDQDREVLAVPGNIDSPLEPGDELPAAAGRQAGHRRRRYPGGIRAGGPGASSVRWPP